MHMKISVGFSCVINLIYNLIKSWLRELGYNAWERWATKQFLIDDFVCILKYIPALVEMARRFSIGSILHFCFDLKSFML